MRALARSAIELMNRIAAGTTGVEDLDEKEGGDGAKLLAWVDERGARRERSPSTMSPPASRPAR